MTSNQKLFTCIFLAKYIKGVKLYGWPMTYNINLRKKMIKY